MPVRVRKFIGTILIVVLVLLYALLANTIAVATLGESVVVGPPPLFLGDGPCLGPAGDADHQMDGRSAAEVNAVNAGITVMRGKDGLPSCI